MKPVLILLAATCALAQAPTTKQLMLDMIHPAANDILLAVNRDEKDWAALRRAALALQESGSLLAAPGRGADWAKDVTLLADAGAAAYKAAQARDTAALAAAADSLDASCTTCHKQFRPNVFPAQGGSK